MADSQTLITVDLVATRATGCPTVAMTNSFSDFPLTPMEHRLVFTEADITAQRTLTSAESCNRCGYGGEREWYSCSNTSSIDFIVTKGCLTDDDEYEIQDFHEQDDP